MFPVDKVELLTLGCSGLREITPVVDHRPVNCQVIKHFLGDEPGETETGKEGVAPRAGRRRAAAAARASAVAGWGWGWGAWWGTLCSEVWAPHGDVDTPRSWPPFPVCPVASSPCRDSGALGTSPWRFLRLGRRNGCLSDAANHLALSLLLCKALGASGAWAGGAARGEWAERAVRGPSWWRVQISSDRASRTVLRPPLGSSTGP